MWIGFAVLFCSFRPHKDPIDLRKEIDRQDEMAGDLSTAYEQAQA